MTTHVIGDTSVLTSRSLRHILRSPDTIITTAVTPIALMLLFVYVLGGAINTGSDESYVNYMLPGILLITIASGVAYRVPALPRHAGRHLRPLPVDADRQVEC